MPTTQPLTPILEYIAQDVETSLRTITVAGGYRNDVAAVERWRLRGNYPGDRKLFVRLLGATAMIDGEADRVSCGDIRWMQRVRITAFVAEREDSIVPIERRIVDLFADILQCLCSDDGYTRGGYAEDTLPGEFIPFDVVDQPEMSGFDVEVVVPYHHLFTDPASQT